MPRLTEYSFDAEPLRDEPHECSPRPLADVIRIHGSRLERRSHPLVRRADHEHAVGPKHSRDLTENKIGEGHVLNRFDADHSIYRGIEERKRPRIGGHE
jgi:hypothetical protein